MARPARAAIVIGAQWGDEGKGKVVDVLAAKADVVVRFGGGANAGHTLVLGDDKYVLHLVPSGILNDACTNIIGGGCVIDAESLLEEMRVLEGAGVRVTPDRLLLAENAHVVTPYHRMTDQLSGGRIGTTGRGIGPAYADKALRIGVRLADLRDGTLDDKVRAQCAQHGALARALHGHVDVPDEAAVLERLREAGRALADHIVDVTPALASAGARGARVLFEGAQGVLLDLDHGTYPFVTSSNTTIAGATAGLGAYTEFDPRIAVVKAYTTRVGHGPFATELEDEIGERLRERGDEYGATTGRPRRCGWLDLVTLKRAFRANAFTHFALTKLDVLSGIGPIRVAVDRTGDGAPVYRTFEGFEADLSAARDLDNLPVSCMRFIAFLEEELDARLLLLSTGRRRQDSLVLGPPW